MINRFYESVLLIDFTSFVLREEMNFIRTFCTRRKEYTFANGVRNSRNHQIPPTFVALPENRQPLAEAERNARRVQNAQRRAQAVLRAEELEAERQRRELELAAAQRFEIQQAAQEIFDREIAVMPRPKGNSNDNGVFF